jgi:hypothetical protein
MESRNAYTERIRATFKGRHRDDAATNQSPPAAEPTLLCTLCTSLDLKAQVSPNNIRYMCGGTEGTTLTFPRNASTTSSCSFCRLIAHSLGGDSLVTKLTFEFLGDTRTLEGKLTQSFCIRPWNGSSRGNRIAPLGRDAFRVSCQKFSYPRRFISPDVADRDLMRGWISRSYQTQKKSMSMLASKLSKHLVDVRNMCIVDCGVSAEPYFALSYVWGNVESLQLVKNNRALLMLPGNLRLQLEALAPVIQDAIQITRELGHQYLWVDSLCIVQDDTQNKHRQISNMNHIYLQADVTLVAAHTGHAANGLPGVRLYESARYQHTEKVLHMEMAVIQPDVSELPSVYFQRAWTYQEERLSHRLLYFTDSQVYFSDSNSSFSEDRHEDDLDCNMSRTGVLLGQMYPLSTLDWWKKSVHEYSARDLSFSDDRYNAFCGIETELQQRWHYHCLRGVPLDDFVDGLFWDHNDSVHATGAVRVNTLPSWSWCGWTGPVSHSIDTLCSMVTIIKAVDGSTIWPWQTEKPLSSLNYEQTFMDPTATISSISESANGSQIEHGHIIHQSISAGFVLRFQALSALVEVELVQVKEQTPFYRIPNARHSPCGSFYLHNTGSKFPDNICVECIVLGKSNNQHADHLHFDPAPEDEPTSETPRQITSSSTKRRLITRAIQACKKDTPKEEPKQMTGIEHNGSLLLSEVWIVLVVKPQEDGTMSSDCERVGIFKIHEHCLLAWHPVVREVSLA